MNLYAPAITLAALGILALGGGFGYAIARNAPAASTVIAIPGNAEQCQADLEQLVMSQVDRERSIVVTTHAAMEAAYADEARNQAR